tara:strand:+ start:1018 stop:1509 length:492 start_codon:yes stop_codon:yes gene_type:complete
MVEVLVFCWAKNMKIETLLNGFYILWAILFSVGVYRTYKRYRASKMKTLTTEIGGEKLNRIRKGIRSVRWMGWTFFFVGSLMAVFQIPEFFAEDGIVMVNGQPRDELWVKISASLFMILLPIFGATLAFTPRKRIESCCLKFQMFSERFATNSRKSKNENDRT